MIKLLLKAGNLFFLPFYLYAQDSPLPRWIINPPETNSKYYRSFTEWSTLEVNYKQRAQSDAKQKIANQIQSNISGRIISESMEEMDITTKNEFSIYFTSITTAQLQNIKLSTHEDSNRKRYYVFIEYSKKDHKRSIQKNKDKALGLYKEYRESDQMNVAARLQKLVQAYEYLTLVYDEKVEFKEGSKNVDLSTAIQGDIRGLLNQLEFTIGYNRYTGVTNRALDRDLIFDIVFKPPPPFRLKKGSNLPVEFIFERGSGVFNTSSSVYSDRSGKAKIGVSQITSTDPNQTVKATIDLTRYTLGLYDSDYFFSKLRRLSDNPSTTFKISVSSQLNETIAIYVHSEAGVDIGSTQYADSQFNKEISNRGKFKIKGSRDDIVRWLGDGGYSQSSLCDDNECRIDLGAYLQVDKLLLIKLNVIKKDDLFTCEVVYTNPEDKESRTIGFFETKMSGKPITSIVREKVNGWVEDFYDNLNPATLDFKLGPGLASVDLYVDEKFKAQLPFTFDLSPRENAYTLMFSALGYEDRIKQYSLGPNNKIESTVVGGRKQYNTDIRLTSKTRSRAFMRSIVYPGWGQVYSHDKRYTSNRKSIGRGMMFGGILTLIGAAYSWDNYNKSLNIYNASKKTYDAQTTMEGIQEWNQKAVLDNQKMKDDHAIAISISLIGLSYWIGSAIEAVINMPDY